MISIPSLNKNDFPVLNELLNSVTSSDKENFIVTPKNTKPSNFKEELNYHTDYFNLMLGHSKGVMQPRKEDENLRTQSSIMT